LCIRLRKTIKWISHGYFIYVTFSCVLTNTAKFRWLKINWNRRVSRADLGQLGGRPPVRSVARVPTSVGWRRVRMSWSTQLRYMVITNYYLLIVVIRRYGRDYLDSVLLLDKLWCNGNFEKLHVPVNRSEPNHFEYLPDCIILRKHDILSY